LGRRLQKGSGKEKGAMGLFGAGTENGGRVSSVTAGEGSWGESEGAETKQTAKKSRKSHTG